MEKQIETKPETPQDRAHRLSHAYKDLRRGKLRKFKCPICQVLMKRKGHKGKDYFKCKQCGGKYLPNQGIFVQKPDPDTIEMRNTQLKEQRQEMVKRKLIIRMKKDKYKGFGEMEFGGEYIRFADYDVDGISFEEKKRAVEERQKRLEEQKAEAKKKELKEKLEAKK